MEPISNCCGARVDGLNADYIGRCSECGEGCGTEGIGINKIEQSPIFSIDVGSEGQELLEHILKEINKSFKGLDYTGVRVRISIPNIGKPAQWRLRTDIDYDDVWEEAKEEGKAEALSKLKKKKK